MAQVTGRVTITINGTAIESNKGAKLDVGGVTRASQTSDQAVNFSESLRPSKIECEFPWTAETSLTALNDIKDATFQFQADTGKSWVVNNGFRTGDLTATAGESGNIPVTLEGDAATEIGSA